MLKEQRRHDWNMGPGFNHNTLIFHDSIPTRDAEQPQDVETIQNIQRRKIHLHHCTAK